MSSGVANPGLWLPIASLFRREVVRFYRQPSRVIGALASPLLFWVLIGSGLGRSFRAPGGASDASYLEYFFPGTLALILLFTAIFSTVSVIEDRREGFLQAVLVSPVPRASVVLAKLLGGTALAAMQGYLFLLLLPLAGVHPQLNGLIAAILFVPLVAFAMTGLGFLVAWPMESTQGFHSVMNLLLIPMWILSGALFPLEGAAAPIRWVMQFNPMTYSVAGLRAALYWEHGEGVGRFLMICFLVTLLFGVATATLSVLVTRKQPRGAK